MLFSSTFIAAASMLLAKVTALPQSEDGGLMARAPTSCNFGSYLNGTTCVQCPAGSYCADGKTKQPCDHGTFQPNRNATECRQTEPGHYQNVTGATIQVPCYKGSYQPYRQQSDCYGAPSGRFQSMIGQATVCGTCCGWTTTMGNFNVRPVKCSESNPKSYPGSGSGCLSNSTDTGCMIPETCAQNSTGGCPAQTWGA